VNSLRELIHDWGTHPRSQLYNQALVHQFGVETNCLRRVEVRSRSILLGTHCVQFYASGHAFVVTTLTRDQDAYRQHLNTLLTHADLQAMQWINLNHSRVEISTLVRD
jgi:hypothetical protein